MNNLRFPLLSLHNPAHRLGTLELTDEAVALLSNRSLRFELAVGGTLEPGDRIRIVEVSLLPLESEKK